MKSLRGLSTRYARDVQGVDGRHLSSSHLTTKEMGSSLGESLKSVKKKLDSPINLQSSIYSSDIDSIPFNVLLTLIFYDSLTTFLSGFISL